jgi:O-antigen/teichoic acid export membrane protein
MLKKLLSDTAVYGVSSILARIINYALVPLHTAVFATGSYGIISEFYAYAALLNVLFTYGMETAYFRFAAKKANNPELIYNQSLSLLLVSTLLLSGTLLIFASPIAALLGYTGQSEYVVWFALLIGVDTITVIPFARLRLEGKAKTFALLKTANILVNVGLNYFFFTTSFYRPEIGIGYAFIANLIANALFIPMLWRYFYVFRFSFDAQTAKTLLAYGMPILLSGIAYSINEVADRILLKYMLPDYFYADTTAIEAVGIYSACYKLSIFITLAVQAYKYAAEPFFFKKAEDKDSTDFYAKSMNYFLIACLLMFLGVTANLELISAIFLRRASYTVGLSVVPYLLAANIFLGMYYNFSIWFKIKEKTKYGAYFSAVGALITMIANFLLIPVLGYIGSAVTTALSYGTMACLCYFYGQKYYPIPYPVKTMLAYMFFAFGLGAMMFYVPIESKIVQILFNNSLAGLFLGVVYLKEKKKV